MGRLAMFIPVTKHLLPFMGIVMCLGGLGLLSCMCLMHVSCPACPQQLGVASPLQVHD